MFNEYACNSYIFMYFLTETQKQEPSNHNKGTRQARSITNYDLIHIWFLYARIIYIYASRFTRFHLSKHIKYSRHGIWCFLPSDQL